MGEDAWCDRCSLPSRVAGELHVYALDDDGVRTLTSTTIWTCITVGCEVPWDEDDA